MAITEIDPTGYICDNDIKQAINLSIYYPPEFEQPSFQYKTEQYNHLQAQALYSLYNLRETNPDLEIPLSLQVTFATRVQPDPQYHKYKTKTLSLPVIATILFKNNNKVEDTGIYHGTYVEHQMEYPYLEDTAAPNWLWQATLHLPKYLHKINPEFTQVIDNIHYELDRKRDHSIKILKNTTLDQAKMAFAIYCESRTKHGNCLSCDNCICARQTNTNNNYCAYLKLKEIVTPKGSPYFQYEYPKRTIL